MQSSEEAHSDLSRSSSELTSPKPLSSSSASAISPSSITKRLPALRYQHTVPRNFGSKPASLASDTKIYRTADCCFSSLCWSQSPCSDFPLKWSWISSHPLTWLLHKSTSCGSGLLCWIESRNTSSLELREWWLCGSCLSSAHSSRCQNFDCSLALARKIASYSS